MRRSFFLSLIIALPVLAHGARAESPILEGSVFDTHTGTPLRSVEIVVSTGGSLETSVARPVETDSHGFYSVEIPDRELGQSLQITATCHTRTNREIRDVSSGETHPLLVRPETMRRDLYLPVFRQTSARRCEKILHTLGQ